MDQEIFLEEKGPRQTRGQSDEVRGGVGSCWYLDTEKNQESQTQTKKPPHSLAALQNESWGWDRGTPLEGWFLVAFLKPCGGCAGEAQAALHSLCPRGHSR